MTTPREPAPAIVAMRRSSLRLFALAVALAVELVCAGARGAPAAADPTDAISAAERSRVLAQMDSIGRRGFLYEVVKSDGHPDNDAAHGKRLFLYGTIHVGRVGSEPFNAAVLQALRQSRRIALEADPTDGEAARRLVAQLGRYDDGDGLERHLSPPLLARVEAFGAMTGVPRDQLARFKPWLLANMVTLQQMNASGLDADLGSELYLAGFAHGNGLPIVEIEGMEAQLRLLASLPDALQAAQLDEALDEIDGGTNSGADTGSNDDVQDDTRALFALWQDGDAAAGEALVAQMHEQARTKPFERYFVEHLIDDRNRTMADHAENDLERPGNTFFAVGSLHLFGEAGLIRTFERRGYRVTDLQPPMVHQDSH